jgi:hypothetical protein
MRDHTAGEGTPRDATDALIGEQTEHLAFLFTVDQAVLVLHGDEACPPAELGRVLQFGELPGPHARRAEVPDFAR